LHTDTQPDRKTMKPLFTEREVRAVAIFLPLALLTITAIALLRPRTDRTALLRAEQEEQTRADTLRPARFDPNTVTYEQLREMGLAPTAAAGLIRYRESGKVFAIPEDVATCYAIDDSLYRRLKPFIRIGRLYARSVRADRRYRNDRMIAEPLEPQPFRIDTVSARYLRATGLLSQRRAATFVKWRDTHPIEDMDEVRRCYAIDDSTARILEPYIIFPEKTPRLPLEINGADSAQLLAITGIGEKTAGEIVRYRERLGGFVRAEQLAEVKGMTERNYERILQQICCDSCKIRKIHINFADPIELARHPYMPRPALRKLLKQRELKGGWSAAEAFHEDHILKPDEARRLAPYLSFDLPDNATGEQTTE